MNIFRAFWVRTRQILEMVKFEHTIFALPFALMSALLAADGKFPPLDKLGWILLAMVGARSAAMAFNRLADAKIDAENPRTATRHIPAGILTKTQVGIFLAISIALFEWAAYRLGTLCFALSPVALVFILGYSLTKRFTAMCHLFLGFAIGIAPTGAWLAIRGTFDLVPILLSLAVMLWIGGFDMIYALQDYEHDVQSRLHSFPKAFGKVNALRMSRLMHFIMVLLLVAVGVQYGLHLIYYLGVVFVAALIIYEQSLVRHNDLSKVNLAFFTLNGWVSISLFFFVLLDTSLLRG